MVDERIVVHMLFPVGDGAAIEVHRCSPAGEDDVRLVARDAAGQRQRGVGQMSASGHVRRQVREPTATRMRLFQFIEFHTGTFAHTDLHRLCSQEILVVGCVVAEE